MERSTRHFDSVWGVEAINDSIDMIDSELADVHPDMAGVISTNLSYAAGTQEQNLPVGFQEMVMVEVTDLGASNAPYPRLYPARFTDRSGFLQVASPALLGGGLGEPSHYYIRLGDPASGPMVFGMIPVPARTAAANVLAWFHGLRADVATIDAATYPDIPVLLHPAIARYMCVLAAMADGAKVEWYTGLYNSGMEKRLAQLIRGATEEQTELIDIADAAEFEEDYA